MVRLQLRDTVAMAQAVIRTTLLQAKRLQRGLNALAGEARWFTAADEASGHVVPKGSGRRVRAWELQAKHGAPILQNGLSGGARRWAIRWRALAPYAGQTATGLPGGDLVMPTDPSGPIDDTWTRIAPPQREPLPPKP